MRQANCKQLVVFLGLVSKQFGRFGESSPIHKLLYTSSPYGHSHPVSPTMSDPPLDPTIAAAINIYAETVTKVKESIENQDRILHRSPRHLQKSSLPTQIRHHAFVQRHRDPKSKSREDRHSQQVSSLHHWPSHTYIVRQVLGTQDIMLKISNDVK